MHPGRSQDGQKSTPYITVGLVWLYRTKLSAFLAPRRRQRPAEQKSQTASYGGGKSARKYRRVWKFSKFHTLQHFRQFYWLHRTKLSTQFAPWRRWRAGEHKSQTASYGGAKSGLKYWRVWNFAAKTSVREAARGQILETVGLFRHVRPVRDSAEIGCDLDPVGGQDCLADKACD